MRYVKGRDSTAIMIMIISICIKCIANAISTHLHGPNNSKSTFQRCLSELPKSYANYFIDLVGNNSALVRDKRFTMPATFIIVAAMQLNQITPSVV